MSGGKPNRPSAQRRPGRRRTSAQHKWTPVDRSAAEKLIEATSAPGVVYPVATSALPQPLQAMPGAVSYFVSGYSTAVPIAPGLSAGGEIAVVRTDADLAKAYNYVLATSSNGQVYFNGPYKNFPGHHFDPASAVTVASLFGHGPFKEP